MSKQHQPRRFPDSLSANGSSGASPPGSDLALVGRYRASYDAGYAKGKAEVEAVHLRVIAALVAQLGGRATVADEVLCGDPLLVRTWRDEAVPGWAFSVTEEGDDG